MRFDMLCVGLTSAALFAACGSDTAPTSPRRIGVTAASHDEGRNDNIIVVGTGDPAIDVPAVQAAVDHGGEIVLRGHFSFDAPGTKPLSAQLTAGGGIPPFAEVLIAHAVSISGATGLGEDMATIERGTVPFYIDARGQSVSIRGLRFVDPTASAILVFAVQGLEVSGSRIEGAVPFHAFAQGIEIVNANGVPGLANPGHPENVSGSLRIVDNDIDMTGATALVDNTLGLTVLSVGVPGAEVDAYVARNTIRNVTEPAINFRRIIGRVDIEHNVIATGVVPGNATRNSAIRVANTGLYRIAHNSISCDWPVADAEGIGMFSQVSVWPMEHAVVEHNDIRMGAPAGTVFTTFSGGIALYGYVDSAAVTENTIRGTALAGISIVSVFPQPPAAAANPTGNTFVHNRFVEFTSTVSDIFVGTNARGTRIIGSGTVVDQGTGTTITP
jgi:hypothetical protein